jgi:hypothetical protein
MVGANHIILDQIARFFILLSNAPLYWFTLNQSKGGGADNNGSSTHLSRINTTIDKVMGLIGSGGGQWHLKAALVYCGKVAVENGVWQRWQQVVRVGTQQSTNNPLQWTMTSWRWTIRGVMQQSN